MRSPFLRRKRRPGSFFRRPDHERQADRAESGTDNRDANEAGTPAAASAPANNVSDATAQPNKVSDGAEQPNGVSGAAAQPGASGDHVAEQTLVRPSGDHVTTAARSSEAVITTQVPFALRTSAAWAWRLAIVGVVAVGIFQVIHFFEVLVIPLMVAALLGGLLSPLVRILNEHRVPRGLSVAIVELGFIAVLGGTIALVGRQIVVGFVSLAHKLRSGFHEILHWMQQGPLHVTTHDLEGWLKQGNDAIAANKNQIATGAISVGHTAGEIGTGILLTLFTLIFFLLEGDRIWRFLVGMIPQRARSAVDGAGRRGWQSMTSWVRVQIIVAAIDAIGIGVGAAILGVPLALPLGVLVFLGSFIPILGALVTGIMAAILALVSVGVVPALVMLAIVLVVHQVEAHVIQPFLMGRAVSLHPLAVVLAVGAGTIFAGVVGALFAVPLLAVVNAMVRYIVEKMWLHDDAVVRSVADGYGIHAKKRSKTHEKEAHSGDDELTRIGEDIDRREKTC